MTVTTNRANQIAAKLETMETTIAPIEILLNTGEWFEIESLPTTNGRDIDTAKLEEEFPELYLEAVRQYPSFT